jgi:hypothetical protein
MFLSLMGSSSGILIKVSFHKNRTNNVYTCQKRYKIYKKRIFSDVGDFNSGSLVYYALKVAYICTDGWDITYLKACWTEYCVI